MARARLQPARAQAAPSADACARVCLAFGSSYGRCHLRSFNDSAGCPQDAINDLHRRLRGRECPQYPVDGFLHRRVDGPHLRHAAGIFPSYRAHITAYLPLRSGCLLRLLRQERCRVAVRKDFETDRSLLPAAGPVYCVRQRNILDNFRADGARDESDGSGCAGGRSQRPRG